MTTDMALLIGLLTAAITGVIKLVSDGFAGPRAKQAATMAAANERGMIYEEFVAHAIAAVGRTEQVVRLAPRPAFLPPSRYCLAALEEASAAGAGLNRVSARLRRLAPDDVAAAADGILKLVDEAFSLMTIRSGRGWEDLWRRLRDARIGFEELARLDSTGRHGRRPRRRTPQLS